MSTRRLLIAALLCASTMAFAQYPPGGRERAEKFFAAMTKADGELMREAQAATTAALTEYFHGTMERAIPLLERSIELDRQQLRAFAAAAERAGLADWGQSESGFDHMLALSHGRLARAYFLMNRRNQCLRQLALAVDLGAKALEKMKREAMLAEAADVLRMDSPDRVIAAVQRYDAMDRERVRPAQRDAMGEAASANPYTPGRADCMLEADARQPSPRAPRQ